MIGTARDAVMGGILGAALVVFLFAVGMMVREWKAGRRTDVR